MSLLDEVVVTESRVTARGKTSGNRSQTLSTLVVHTIAIMAIYLLLTVVLEVNQFWTITIVFVVDLFIATDTAIDRLLVVTALAIGVLPFLGWFQLPIAISPLGILSSAYLFTVLRNIRRFSWSTVLKSFSISPAIAAATLTYQWWSGLSIGPPVVVLERLLPIWDMSAHFDFFFSSLINGQYLRGVSNAGVNTRWFGEEYPSGFHYLVGLFSRGQRARVIENPTTAVPIFATSIVVALAACVFFTSVCGGRLTTKSSIRFLYTAISAGLAVAIISLGPVSQTISTGFVNMPVVVISLLIMVSIHFRPLKNENTQLIVVASCLGGIAYNWYPALILVAPIVIFELLTISKKAKKICVAHVIVLTTILVCPPIVQTFSLGLSHLNLDGGIQPFPAGFLAASLMISFSLAIFAPVLKADRWKYFSTNVSPLPVAITYAIFLHLNSKGYNYYFHKSMIFVATFASFTLLFSLLHTFARNQNLDTDWSPRLKATLIVGSVFVALGLSQMFGYWGPTYPALSGLSTAYGVLNRNEISNRSPLFLENADEVDRLLERTKELSVKEKAMIVLFVPETSESTLSPTNAPTISVLTNLWFHGLSQSLTIDSHRKSLKLASLQSFSDDKKIANSLFVLYKDESVFMYSTPLVIKNLAATRVKTSWILNSL